MPYDIVLNSKNNMLTNIDYRRNLEKKESGAHINDNKNVSFGRRWDKYAAWTLKNIESFSSVKEAINFAQVRHGFELRECDNLNESVSKWENKVKLEFPHFSAYFDFFSEPEYLSNNTIATYKGRLMSSMLCHLIRFHFAALSYCSFPKIVCEIGGGYGAPARVWMKSPIFQPQIYIIVDLAESLFFSECFLKKEFLARKDIDVINLANYDVLPSFKEEKRLILLCPSEKIELLLQLDIDLIINTLSMQEMSEEWVDIYMKWLDQTKAKHFYSFNAFMTPISKMHEVTNVYCPRPSKQWIARISSFPYAEGPAAEIVYDRIDAERKFLENNSEIMQHLLTSIKEREHYLKFIEYLRFCTSKELIFQFTQLFLNEPEFIPKEIAYFCDLLLMENKIEDENRQQLLELKERIDRIRKSSEEGVVDAFVDF